MRTVRILLVATMAAAVFVTGVSVAPRAHSDAGDDLADRDGPRRPTAASRCSASAPTA